ncbi:hypothetical protein V502_02161 [Pseudogymnoascus sp. VKM F-4520 (FW-2644)]|nr:hypothetical protein V502_02161 [Pseudogymnoascus sp. VKM F-4520 (FW-2644)]
MVQLVGSTLPRQAVAAQPRTLTRGDQGGDASGTGNQAKETGDRLRVQDPVHTDPSDCGGGVHSAGEGVLTGQRRDSGALPHGAELSPGMSRQPALQRAPDN